jgi:hypothetical protein
VALGGLLRRETVETVKDEVAEAIRKRTTVSAVAGELLDRTLPRFRVEREA